MLLFLIVAWAALTAVAGGSPWFPIALIGGALAAEPLLGLNRRSRGKRLLLLLLYASLGLMIQALVANGPLTRYIFPDEGSYWRTGDLIGRGEALVFKKNHWGAVVGATFGLFGSSDLHMRGLSALAGALFIGLLAELAGELGGGNHSDEALMYRVAGAAPVLLPWVTAGIRDMTISLGMLLLVSPFLSRHAAIRRAAIGAAVIHFLRPDLQWYVIPVLGLGVVVRMWFENKRLRTLAAGLALGVGGYVLSAPIVAAVTNTYLSPSDRSKVNTLLGSVTESLMRSLTSKVISMGLLGIVPGLAIALLTPIWFAEISQFGVRSIVLAIGGLGWWLLLPAVALGAKQSLKEPRLAFISVWALSSLLLTSASLFTIFQEPPRIRLTGLGAFLLLAWFAIRNDRSAVRRATTSWTIVMFSLASLYWMAKLGFPIVHRFGV